MLWQVWVQLVFQLIKVKVRSGLVEYVSVELVIVPVKGHCNAIYMRIPYKTVCLQLCGNILEKEQTWV